MKADAGSVLILFLCTVASSSSLLCKQNATREGPLVYNSTSPSQPLNEGSCILYNNSAVLGSEVLYTIYGIICHSPSSFHTATWYHPNDAAVMLGPTYRVFIGFGVLSELRRSGQFTSAYNGIYTCIVTDQRSNDTERIFIGIYASYPALRANNLTISTLLDNTGTKLVLNCSSTGLPATTVRWFFRNRLISLGERTQLITGKLNAGYHSLLILTKQEIDLERLQANGRYTCSVDTSVAVKNVSRDFNILPSTPAPAVVMNNSTVISWITSSDYPAILQYQLEFEGGHCGTRELVLVNVTHSGHSVSVDVSEISLLNRGANYTVRIKALNAFVGGGWSDGVSLQTERSSPTDTPENVKALPMASSVLVMWSDVNCLERNGLITQYQVTYSAEEAPDSSIEQVNVTEMRANLTGLSSGVRYLVSVAAVNEAGIGPAYTLNVTIDIIDEDVPRTVYIVSGLVVVAVLFLSVLLVCCCLIHRRRKAKSAKSAKPMRKIQDSDKLLMETDIDIALASNEPVISDFPCDLEVSEGEYVLLYVTVSGNPPPILTWYHNSESITTDPSIEVGGDGTLSIPSMEERHVGTYRLVASNCYGSCYEEMVLDLEDEDTFVLRRAESIASMVDSSPVPVSSLEEYVSLHHRKNNEAFHFQFLCLNSYLNMPTTAGSVPENRVYNRFKNILPYDENRVTLNPVPGYSECQNDYINASYIDGYTPCKFIATQGPLPHTVVDFWRLVWQESTSVIVMLCDIVESHRVKCQQYWPESGSQTYGPICVQKLHEVKVVGHVVRKFEISMPSGPSLKVTHYQFKGWPDHSVPECAGELLSLINRIGATDGITEGAILVHCSAGVGRTGVFIALDTALCQAREDNRVDIIGIINNMRYQRMKMVQTLAQFIFIHDAILENLVCGNTQIAIPDFRLTWNRLRRVNKDTGKTDLENQYRILKKITPTVSEADTKVAQRHPHLNRSMDYLPRDQKRVILDIAELDHDYIHASFVDGYKQKKAFIIAQSPMESTCNDFWQMTHQYQCGTIIMLSPLTEYEQEVCCQYWPREGLMNYGLHSVELLSESQAGKDITTRELLVTNRKSKAPQEVTQFQVENWTPDGLCADYRAIADLIEKVIAVQRRTGNKPIVVHCSDTVSRSAIFCAAMTAIERFKADSVVDIYKIVKSIRLQKTSAIMSVEQYSVVFSIVLAYSDGIDDKYDNFKPHTTNNSKHNNLTSVLEEGEEEEEGGDEEKEKEEKLGDNTTSV